MTAGGGPRLVRAASMLAAASVASRLLGLTREIIVAALFGASDAKAAYIIGYYLPFFVQRLMIGGTLSIVLIPALAGVLARGDGVEVRRVTAQLFTAVLSLGVAMVAVGQLAAPLLVPIAAPGFLGDPEQVALTVRLTRINFLAMFFLGLSIFATAFLQAQRRFVPPAVAPLAFNLVTIAGTVLLGPRIGIVGLSVAWIAGTAAQFLVQVPALLAGGFRFQVTFDWSHPAIRTARRLALPAIVGLAVVEINAYIGRFLASLLPGGPGTNAVAALDYAYEIMQAPVGILAISVATVLFPGMSRSAAAGDRQALVASAALGLRSVVFLMLPVSAGLALFARPVVRLVFERGEFGPATTAVVGTALSAYAVGLVAVSAYYVVTRTYYALHDTRTPVLTGAGTVVLYAILASAFMRLWGLTGIALASAVVSFINVGLLYAILGRRLGSLESGRLGMTALRVGIAAALAVGAATAVVHFGTPTRPPGWIGEAVLLALAAGAAGLVYLAGCVALRVEELGLLRSLIRRRP